MSFAPEPLKELRQYFKDVVGYYDTADDAKDDEYKSNYGIASKVSARRNNGYHLGKSDIFGTGGLGNKDYSILNARDKAGLTDAAAAIDIKWPVKLLKELRAYLVAEARAGRAPDLAEILGPNDNGEARRWAQSNNWQPQPARADHSWHIHLSFRRDSENRDKIALFEKHLGPRPSEVVPVTPEEVMALQSLLNSLGAKLQVDGALGDLTRAALKAAPAQVANLAARANRAEVRKGVLVSIAARERETAQMAEEAAR